MLRSDFNLFKGETDRAHQTSLDVMRLEHKTALSQQHVFIEQFTRENKDLIAKNEEMVQKFDIQIDQKVCEILKKRAKNGGDFNSSTMTLASPVSTTRKPLYSHFKLGDIFKLQNILNN